METCAATSSSGCGCSAVQLFMSAPHRPQQAQHAQHRSSQGAFYSAFRLLLAVGLISLGGEQVVARQCAGAAAYQQPINHWEQTRGRQAGRVQAS